MKKRILGIILLILILIVWLLIYINYKNYKKIDSDLKMQDIKITKSQNGCYFISSNKLHLKVEICNEGIYEIKNTNCLIIKSKKEPAILCK